VRSADERQGVGQWFMREGVVVCPVADTDALNDLRRRVITLVARHLGCRPPTEDRSAVWLDTLHGVVSPATVNALRVTVMAHLGDDPSCRRQLVEVARPWLELLVGNELAIQRRPNLSVQLPGDADSVLPIHADTWSGHSPFEVVLWVPLVDCWGTKSMYVVPPSVAGEVWRRFAQCGGRTTDDLFAAVADDVTWIEARFGQVVLFDQSLPHGNRTNGETTTRWSINCRVTGLFTPYADKGLGDFFTPVSLRPVTARALGLDLGEWW
jgi:sporadic carbohydrate cluster 2OG-Fe(II) oxygenase